MKILKRKIYDKLLSWKKTSNGQTALLIEGARRVGKSTICEFFGKNEYKSYIIIDFVKASKTIKENFENLNNLDIFYQNISVEYKTKLYKRESLIVFDEIQKPSFQKTISRSSSISFFNKKYIVEETEITTPAASENSLEDTSDTILKIARQEARLSSIRLYNIKKK